MKIRLSQILNGLILATCLMLAAVAARAADELLGSSSAGTNPASIYSIDSTTGAATLIGSSGLTDSLGRPNKIAGIANDPADGTLYGIFGSACTGAQLITIDPATGAGTIIGPLVGAGFDGSDDTGSGITGGSACSGGSDALVFGDDGTLFAGGWVPDGTGGRLLTVDKTTGAVLTVLPTDGGAHIAGLAKAPDGTLWVSRGGNGSGLVHTIDPATGMFTSTIMLSDPNARISDIAFGTDGTLFGSDPSTGMLVTISTNPGTVTVIGAFGGGAKISGLSPVGNTVDAGTCTEPDGCTPVTGVTFQVEVEVPPNTPLTVISENEPDPGDNGMDPTILKDGALILPPNLRSSSPIQILEVDTELEITEGTVLITIEPADFLENALTCDTPIPPDVDPQLQDIMVWQPTDAADLLEGHAIEITSECGFSSRGRSRGFSFLTVGLHISCDKDFFEDPWGVKQCFVDFTLEKYHNMLTVIKNAKRAGALTRRQFKKLLALTVISKIAFHWGFYDFASHKMTRVIDKLENIQCADAELNPCGDIAMRAHNIRFNVDKVKNIRDNILGNHH